MIEEIEKIDIRCPKCNKLIAKMRKNGICKMYCYIVSNAKKNMKYPLWIIKSI